MSSALAAVARLLVPAERARRVEPVERVGPHDTRAEAVGDGEDPRALVAPDPGREPVGGVVGLLDRLGGRAEGQHRQHRAEDLVPGDAMARLDVREDRGREPEAVGGYDAIGAPALGALLLADAAELAHAVQLGARV